MFFHDVEPTKQPEHPQPAKVEHFSIEELQEYMGWLDAEKSRAAHEIERKKSATSEAESFFKDKNA